MKFLPAVKELDVMEGILGGFDFPWEFQLRISTFEF